MMQLRLISAIGVAISIAAAPMTAQTQTTESEASWEDVTYKMVAVDTADRNKGTDFYTLIHIVGTQGTDGAILTLSCQQSTSGQSMMQAAIQLDPDNTYEQNPKRRLRTVMRSATLTIGDEAEPSRWSYHRDSSKIVPANRTIPRKLFNAIVQQKPVSVKTQDGEYSVGLPPIDPIFKRFVKQCPITNGTNEVDMDLFADVKAREAAKKASR